MHGAGYVSNWTLSPMAWVILRTGSLDWIKRWVKGGGESIEYQENRDGNWVSSISGVAIDDEWWMIDDGLSVVGLAGWGCGWWQKWKVFDAGRIRIGYVLRLASMLVSVPARCAESNCTIAHAHLGMLSRVEAGASYDFISWKLGICGLRHSLTFPSSVFWQSLRRWEPTYSILLLY